MSSELFAYLDGEAIGVIEQSAAGALSFTYDADFRSRRDATPLSPRGSDATPQRMEVRHHPAHQHPTTRWGRLGDFDQKRPRRSRDVDVRQAMFVSHCALICPSASIPTDRTRVDVDRKQSAATSATGVSCQGNASSRIR